MSYKTKYVRSTKLRDVLIEDEKKIRISAEAKDLVYKYFDKAVEQAAKDLIDLLPRKSKGKSKGELKRITLQEDDFKDVDLTLETVDE